MYEKSTDTVDNTYGGIAVGMRDRFLAWLVTGPIARVVGFVCELAVAWWRWARGLPPQED